MFLFELFNPSTYSFVFIKDGMARVVNENDPLAVELMRDDTWEMVWDSARNEKEGLAFAKKIFKAIPYYTDKFNPIPLASKKILYRSVSINELIDIWNTKKVVGKGNKFNQFDGRNWVFFADAITPKIIYQGEEKERQAEVKLLLHPIQKDFAKLTKKLISAKNKTEDWLNDKLLDYNDKREQNDMEPIKRNNEWDTYMLARCPYNTGIYKLEQERSKLQKKYKEIFKDVYKNICDEIDKLPYTSAIIETKPIQSGFHYSNKHGQSGMGPEDEYGMKPGFVKLSDITKIHLVKNKEIVKVIPVTQLGEIVELLKQNLISESITPISNKYPKMLNDENEIADYIENISVDYVDHDFVVEYFRGCHATLVMLPIDQIHEGNKDSNLPNTSKEQLYSKMNPSSIPPLIVENNIIMDGNHRYRVAKQLGLKMIWCYVVE